MAKQDISTEAKQDEFSKIFDEYRAKIEEITRRAEKNIQSIDAMPGDKAADNNEHIEVVKPSQPEAAVNDGIQPKTNTLPPPQTEPVLNPAVINTVTNIKTQTAPPPQAEPPPQTEATANSLQIKATITPPPQPEPEIKTEVVPNRANGGRPAFEGYTEIIQDARREAKKIIEEAEESAKKEAKKRTQSQADKIIEKARKDAEEIIERANRNAEKVKDDVIAESKREADYIIRDITQKYRQETEAQSTRAMAEAQGKAQQMLANISVSTTLVGQRITEIVTRAKKTIDELETSLHAEATELTRIITDTQSKLEEISKTIKVEKVEKSVPLPSPSPSRQITEPKVNPTLDVRLIGEKSSGNNGTGILFSGQMEMKSVSEDFDYQYLKKLKKHLVHIPSIKYLQEYASEKEMSVVFDVLEPLPLLDILSNIPMVQEVITRADDDICLVFKNSE
jgi:vacuolar-type H+-ATPase subunit H